MIYLGEVFMLKGLAQAIKGIKSSGFRLKSKKEEEDEAAVSKNEGSDISSEGPDEEERRKMKARRYGNNVIDSNVLTQKVKKSLIK